MLKPFAAFIFLVRLSLILWLTLPWSILGQRPPPAQAAGPQTEARFTAEQAAAIAVNNLRPSPEGYHLRHPSYTVDFTRQGLWLLPQGGGPAWGWQLAEVTGGQGQATATPVLVKGVRPSPEATSAGRVVYERAGLVEQYLLGSDHIEQQFILPQPLLPAGVDLVISGQVSSPGALEMGEEGWVWRTAEGEVSLGQVWVFDATGKEIPARLEVTARQTRLVVDGEGLTNAVYPITIDPEIGANDFRLSDMGVDGNPASDGAYPAVAYNSTNNEYLVVWLGNEGTAAEYEIYGQRVNAITGAEVGPNDFRLSDMGPNGNANFDALYPAVAYNSTNNEYLVVWIGDDNTPPLMDQKFEVFGQRVSVTGAEVGVNDFRISNMGPEGNAEFDVSRVAVAYNSTNNEYLVVWEGEGTIINEFEIHGQRLNAATGAEVGPSNFRLSDMGPEGNHNFDAATPAIAYNSTNNEYLVVWSGNDTSGGEFDIYGQRLNAAGTQLGTNDFRLSDMGPNNNQNFDAVRPAVAYNSTNNEYLVVWQGDDNIAPLVDNEFEIFGQRVNAAGTQVGTNDFRISDMGPNGNPNFGGFELAVTYNTLNNQYLVVWRGDDNIAPLVDNEFEIFGQWLNGANGAEVTPNDFRLSDMGGDGNPNLGAAFPAAAYNSTNNEYLVTWLGDDVTNEEFEIYGQRYQPEPEIELRGNGVTIVDGDTTPSLADHTHFGNVSVGQNLVRTFTIVNSGAGFLHLNGSPRVAISGPGAASFTLVTAPNTPVLNGSSTPFQVRFQPTSTGVQTATLTIANNDSNETPYDFTIQGAGINLAPVANAGPDQNLGAGLPGTLNGGGSNDPDGHLPLSFRWTQTGGPAVILSSNVVSRPTFTAPSTATVLAFSLTVTDNLGLTSAADAVVVNVTRLAPVANAGPDQDVGAELTATLDGSGSFDPDKHLPLSFRWTQTGGPDVDLSSDVISRPTFTAPTFTTTLTFSLRVTDNIGLGSAADQVVVTVTKLPPVADAGADQSLGVGLPGTLDGSGSFDPDKHLPLSFLWTQTGGPAVVLSSETISRPTFTAPVTPTVLTFSLMVTDNVGLAAHAPDEVVVTTTKLPPVANAGPDQKVGFGTVVTLTGSGSFDPDGHLPLSFRWTQTSGPTVSFNQTVSRPTFTAPGSAAILTFNLRVTDTTDLGSNLDQVIVTVTDVTPPSKPTLITPTGGIALNLDRPKFDWNDSTDNVGVISYTLRLTGTNAISAFVTTVSSFTPTTDLAGGAYSWTVIAYDGVGNASAPATPASFVINTDVQVYLPLLLK